MSERQPDYRPDIEGLRGIAVVPVCFYHAGLPLFPGGYVGVDVFFVISGYLMAKLIGQSLERGDFSLAGFYERRVRRIFPALLAILFFCAIVAAVVVPPRLFRDFGASLLAMSLFGSNILFWLKTANYFDAPSEWNPLLHTWSLAVEEQFYIVFPLFLALVWRFGWRARLGITGLAALVSFALSIWGTANAPTATFYLLPTRAWELLLGSLIALWTMRFAQVDSGREPNGWIGNLGAWLGLALIAVSLFAYDRDMPFPGAYALAPTVGAALLIRYGGNHRNAAARLIAIAPVRFAGRISYSLYLWHWPLIVFAEKYGLLDRAGPIQRVALIALACLIAYLSWLCVEQPFRGRRPFLKGRAAFYGAAACLVVLGAAGALAQMNDGWAGRFPGMTTVSLAPQLAAEQRDERWREFAARSCFVDTISQWDKEECFLGRGADSNALLWGDSFAASYARGFFEQQRPRFNVLQYTSPQCPPLIGYEAASRPQCARFNQQVLEVIKRYHIVTVIMAANWSGYLKSRKMRLENIADTVTALRTLGVRVVFVGQSPIFPFVYPDEYFFKTYGPQRSDRDYLAPLDVDPGINGRMAEFARGALFFDPLAVFCRGRDCVFKRADQYLFVDYGHYAQPGSAMAVEALMKATGASVAFNATP